MARIWGSYEALKNAVNKTDVLEPGDICHNFDFGEGQVRGMAQWTGLIWQRVGPQEDAKNVHHIKVGDEVRIHGVSFYLTEFAQYYDANPMASLTSAADLIEIQKED